MGGDECSELADVRLGFEHLDTAALLVVHLCPDHAATVTARLGEPDATWAIVADSRGDS
jgi:hypothetical protein